MQTKHNPIIVALDGMSKREALALARKLQGQVWGFKVNDLLHQKNGGVTVVEQLKPYGHVFADPKLYDIGNTVRNSLRPYVQAGADFVTIAGDAWNPALCAAAEIKGTTKLLIVTVLTSMDEDDVRKKFNYSLIEYPRLHPIEIEVLKIARLGKECGFDGIVCSAKELHHLEKIGEFAGTIKVVPAIRPLWHQDQNDDNTTRSMTPKEAVELGTDFIVIGRPITKSKDPVAAVARTRAELGLL